MNAALQPSASFGVAGERAERLDALIISNDDALLIELAPLLGDRYRVHALDTPARIGEQIDVSRWIGIVDVVAASPMSAHNAISRLEARYPQCPLIVIATRPEMWMAGVKHGAVLAVIDRHQLATARLGEALQDAADRLRRGAPAALQLEPPNFVPPRGRASPRRGRAPWGRTSWGRAPWIGAAVLCAAGLGVGWVHQHVTAIRGAARGAHGPIDRVGESLQMHAGQVASTPARPAAEPGAASRGQGILELLSAARVAFRDQNLFAQQRDPATAGDSALELYARVLRQDPQNDEALEGMQRLQSIGRDRINAEVARGELDDASRLLDALQGTGIPPADRQVLASAISAARPKWLAQRAAQAIAAGDLTAAQQLIAQTRDSGADAGTLEHLRTQEDAKQLERQLRGMATQVHAAVQVGDLLQPATDSARARLMAMRSIARNQPVTLQAQREVLDALVQAGEQAIRTGRFDSAEGDLSAAGELGSSTLLTAAEAELKAAREAAAGSLRMTTPVVLRATTQPVRAPPPAVSAPAALPAAYIAAKPRRPLPVSYPLGVNQEGTVVVEFTLSANGKASDVTVVQANPTGIFDLDAIRAVRAGRYLTTALVNRQPVRARIRLRFTHG